MDPNKNSFFKSAFTRLTKYSPIVIPSLAIVHFLSLDVLSKNSILA